MPYPSKYSETITATVENPETYESVEITVQGTVINEDAIQCFEINSWSPEFEWLTLEMIDKSIN